jgi:DNA polymerase V
MSIRVDVVYTVEQASRWTGPLFLVPVSAGFPSPADDYLDDKLDLNSYLVEHPAATFFVRVVGDSMIEAGIHSGDLLVVDRALEPADNHVVIAVLDGELTVKRIRIRHRTVFLVSDNAQYAPIQINETMHFEVWGVVTYVIHHL